MGIIAHIDAGKTTTTERMLYYAGVVPRIGDVDSGTTTTDYMEEEAERGITITSAAVSMCWKGHRLNLIDTPGHVDFTVEVERALRAVDGAVAVFDASAGVQAQSYTVLRQSRKFGVPVVAFLNKMDKPNASFEKSLASIREKLWVLPLVLQLPLHEEDGSFEGVIDLVSMQAFRFTGPNGASLEVTKICPSDDSMVSFWFNEAVEARHAMLSSLTERDDTLADLWIEKLDEMDGDETRAQLALSAEAIKSAIRRQTLLQGPEVQYPVMPVLCGASRRDMGVQTLLDAVNDFLPAPCDRTVLQGYSKSGNVVPFMPTFDGNRSAPTIALAFKVIHMLNPQTGARAPLVFFRVYSGVVTPKLVVTNNNCNKAENMGKLYMMHANHPEERGSSIVAGDIGAAFLKHTKTGDTLFHPGDSRWKPSPSTAQDPPEEVEEHEPVHTLEGIQVPQAVISFSIEAATTKQIELLEKALGELTIEDPSLHVSNNEFGQQIISGMGELHLEIILSRLKREYQLPCKLLRAIIEYREGVTCESLPLEFVKLQGIHHETTLFEIDLEVNTKINMHGKLEFTNAVCSVEMTPECAASFRGRGGTLPPLDLKSSAKVKRLFREERNFFSKLIQEAIQDSTSVGPVAGIQLAGLHFWIKAYRPKQDTMTEKQFAQSARLVFHEVLQSISKKQFRLLEPMMDVEVHLTESTFISQVVRSLNERNATSVDVQGDGRSVKAVVPMRNIVRYTTELRQAAKGHANLYTSLNSYRVIEDKQVLSRILRNLGAMEQ